MSLFTKASELPNTDRMLVSVWAERKGGKSTFAVGNPAVGLTHWPFPIFVINTDHSLKELLPSLPPEHRDQIHVRSIAPDDPFLSPAKAQIMLHDADTAIQEAVAEVKKAGNGTLVFDTMTYYNHLIDRAKLEPIRLKREAAGKPLYQYDYQERNEYFRNLILQLDGANINTVLLHHARPQYDQKGEAIPGVFLPQHNSQTEKLVGTQVHLWVQETGEGPLHGATIQFCRPNDALRGKQFYGNFDYPTLYEMIYGKAPSDD